MLGVGIVDGQLLANSLMSLKGNDLKMVYILLCKTNMGQLLTSKTKDLFSKESIDHFSKHLIEEVKKIEHKADSIIQVELLLELTRFLKISGANYSVKSELENQCKAIVQEVYEQFQKQDKRFRVFTESENHSSKLEQMVQFQMGKVFHELDDSFQNFSLEDRQKFSSQVNEYIQSLPEEKQNQIKEKLGMDDLTDDIVLMSIATSGTSKVFTIIAEVSGFSFYSTTTSLVATFPGLFGLTMPLGFYTGVTSTIAVLANPIFLIPLLLGGGVLLVNHQNKSLKSRMLPIILLQIALPYMSKGEENVRFEPFVQEWEKRFSKYKRLHEKLGKIENDQIEARKKMAYHDKAIKKYRLQMDEEIEKVIVEKQQIKNALQMINFDALDISPSFILHSNEYRIVLSKIKELESQTKVSVQSSLISKIGSQIRSLTKILDIKDEENKLDSILDSMVEDVLHSTSSFSQHEREKIQFVERKIEQLIEVKNVEEAEKQKMETKLRYLEQKRVIVNKRLNGLEKENDSLAELYFSNETVQ